LSWKEGKLAVFLLHLGRGGQRANYYQERIRGRKSHRERKRKETFSRPAITEGPSSPVFQNWKRGEKKKGGREGSILLQSRHRTFFSPLLYEKGEKEGIGGGKGKKKGPTNIREVTQGGGKKFLPEKRGKGKEEKDPSYNCK